MIELKKLSRIVIFALKFICFFCALFEVPITAQRILKGVELNESFDVTVPFKLCHQKIDKNITEFDIASDKTSIFIPLQSGKIAKINLTDESSNNSLTWISDLGGEISSNLIFDDGKIYLITKTFEKKLKENIESNDSAKQIIRYTLWSLDTETGLTHWQLGFDSDAIVSLDTYQDKIFLTAKNGTINWIKKNATQKILRKYPAQIISSPPKFFEDKLYIGTEDNMIFIFSVDKSEIVSKIPTLQSPATILAATEGKLFWGERKGIVNLFDTNSNSLIWSVRYGGEISSLTLVGNGILVTSLDNFVYFTSLQKGKKVWRRRLAGRIRAKPLVVGNFAVLLNAADNNAVVLDLRNGKLVNQISLADIGFVLSKPLLFQNSLVFLTNKGVFSFVTTNTNCSQSQKK